MEDPDDTTSPRYRSMASIFENQDMDDSSRFNMDDSCYLPAPAFGKQDSLEDGFDSTTKSFPSEPVFRSVDVMRSVPNMVSNV